MANAGTLSVSILARTGKFRKGMRQVRRDLTTIRRQVFNLGTGFTALATGGGLGLLIKKQFEFIDASTKTADKLGIQTDRLAGMQLASKKAGVQINQMQLGLQRMTRRIAEAAQGTGEAQGALKTLGLDAKQMAKLSPDEQFIAVAKAMQKVSAQGEKIRLGFKLFDSEGVNLINIFKDGTATLDDAFKKAQLFGTAISRFDASKIELANNILLEVKEVITGVAQRIAIDLAPKILVLGEQFVAAATAGEGIGPKVDKALTSSIQFLSTVINFSKKVELGFNVIQAAILKTASLTSSLAERLTFANVLVGKDNAFSSFSEAFDAEASKVADKILKLSDEIDNNSFGEKFIGFIEEADKRADELAKNLQSNAIDPLNDAGTGLAGGATKQTFGQEIDLGRVAISGLTRARDDQRNPQIERTNDLLAKIFRAVGKDGSPLLT